MNGIAERAGGCLKVIMKALMSEMAAVGKEDLRCCLTAALEAMNGDTSHNGFSPAQWVLGKQPRGVGAVIPNEASARLAEHSMVTDDPNFARTVAMREVAKHAMVRMQYSAALRRAEMARSRVAPPWSQYNIGDVVYFFREQKWSGSGQKKKLQLRKWHGPGMLLAMEGGNIPTAAYVTYRGNLTKVAMEHLRPASTLERLTHSDWNDVIDEVLRTTTTTEAIAEGEEEGELSPNSKLGIETEEEDSEMVPTSPEGAEEAVMEEVRRQSVTSQRETPMVFEFPYPAEGLLPPFNSSSQYGWVYAVSIKEDVTQGVCHWSNRPCCQC